MEPSTTERSQLPSIQLAMLPMAAWICDARGRLIATNEHWDRYVGETGAMRSWWLSPRLVHPQGIGELQASWKQAHERGERLQAAVRLRRFDGSWRLHILQLGVVDGSSRKPSWIGTWTDVADVTGSNTDRPSIDLELDRMRSDIISIVGHELRTPLTSIYGMAVTLQRRDGALSARARAQLLDIIVDQTLRMTATVDDALVADGIEHGSLRMNSRRCEISSIVRSVVGTLDAASSRTSIKLQLPCARIDVVVDPERLRQALSNLVENAAKYSADSDEVNVSIRRCGPCACVDVRDHGIGIPHAEQQHVFERFRRLDPNLSRGVAGSGLGLYIARELVRRMGGEVTVRSRPERGSTFTLRVPIKR